MTSLPNAVQQAVAAANNELEYAKPQDGDKQAKDDINSARPSRDGQQGLGSDVDVTTTGAPLHPPLSPEETSGTLSGVSAFRSLDHDTPSARTGPPRSLSFAYSFPHSPMFKGPAHPWQEEPDALPPIVTSSYSRNGEPLDISPEDAVEFRTPLEDPRRDSSYASSGKDIRPKQRSTDDGWLPKGLRWFQDSPRDEHPPSTSGDSYFGASDLPQPPPLPISQSQSRAGSLLSRKLTEEPAENDLQSYGEGDKDANMVHDLEQAPIPSSSKFYPSLLANRRSKKARSQYSQDTDQAFDDLHLGNFGPAHYRAISVPSSPKASTHRKLKRRWSFGSHQRSSPATTRQQSVDGGDNTTTSGTTRAKWNKLRSKLTPHHQHGSIELVPTRSVAETPNVNIIDELIAGGLTALMPKMWLERDEKGHRRVPVLLHRLRLRISDSIHPFHKTKSLFRIECDYADGTYKWVVYRELRDFLNLHGHYTIANAANLGGKLRSEKLPEFPSTSLPYFKFLKKEGGKIGKSEFARLQRGHLEDYLVQLIRAVMFHPSSNRIMAFLEVSALSISLARFGGHQHKAGYLRVEAAAMVLPGRTNTTGGITAAFGRKSAGYRERKEWRWYTVRESYLVGIEEPGELTVYDVFIFDQDFAIERPRRYYRQGLGFLHHEHNDDDHRQGDKGKASTSGTAISQHRRNSSTQTRTTANTEHFNFHVEGPESESQVTRYENRDAGMSRVKLEPPQDDSKSFVSSIRSKVSRIFHRKSISSSITRPFSRSSRGAPSSRMSDSDSDDDEDASHAMITPLADPSITVNPLIHAAVRQPGKETDDGLHDGVTDSGTADTVKPLDEPSKKKSTGKDASRHTFYIINSQMRLKLYAKSERQMLQFITGIENAANESPWTRRNRFDSYAPIRHNVSAQWLVDGRDYFWNVSKAISLAKECIYIHDWWLSPEVLMRRPNLERYRLDKLLERKAKEGVKIYIILYLEVTNRTTPIDSNYTKQRLTGLHPNIMVQRSPSHFQTGTFYWAHHEKMCIIDQAIGFMGGLDLCFGRWDTPQHVLSDDAMDTDRPEIWPGKDYSNPRIGDFYNLSKPEEDMYDRTKIHRMPWHDVSMQIIGEPARDLARHFVQRWNYLLRIKNHSRAMPFLLPPPDYNPGELERMSLTGTCELQIVRSAGPWSLGTPGRVEQSVLNAYMKAIQMSEHFVYFENQFFITSTVVTDTRIENGVGDALVHRIIRAHRDGTPWKCCVMLPLLPGFTFPVDHSDASAIRIILESQNRTISRGPDSIFSRLRREGIDPDEYISFFSLRNWGKLRGDVLTTEQVYIHAKICIVDDRLAIIGSANINERSMRGDRDSELAAVIRDTDLIDGTMAGRPFKVGRFAHTLRMRLMREHLGIDVDAVPEEDLLANSPVEPAAEQTTWDPDHEQTYAREEGVPYRTTRGNRSGSTASNLVHFGAASVSSAAHGAKEALGVRMGQGFKAAKVASGLENVGKSDEVVDAERKDFTSTGEKRTGFASSAVPTLEEKAILEGISRKGSTAQRYNAHPIQTPIQEEPPRLGTDGSPSGSGHVTPKQPSGHALASSTLNGSGILSDENSIRTRASASTDGFIHIDAPPSRSRSRSNGWSGEGSQGGPKGSYDMDSEDHRGGFSGVRQPTLKKNLSLKQSVWSVTMNRPKITFHDFEDPICDAFWKDKWVASSVYNTEIYRKVFHAIPDDLVTTWKQYKEWVGHHDRLSRPMPDAPESEEENSTMDDHTSYTSLGDGHTRESQAQGKGLSYNQYLQDQREAPSSAATTESFKTRNTGNGGGKNGKGGESFDRWEREQMEKLLTELNGHLVIYPTRFLEGEDIANNFLFNADRLLPIPIYV